MTRYAAHKVLILPEAKLLNRAVVEIDHEHGVSDVFVLTEEIHHTVWMDGLIVVSACRPSLQDKDEPLPLFVERMKRETEAAQSSAAVSYAYYIHPFHLQSLTIPSKGSATQL